MLARLGKMNKLATLRLERNHLTSLRHLNQCSNLKHLSIDCNRLTGLTEQDGSAWLAPCNALESLICSDNEIEVVVPRALAGCRNLTELVLSRNLITDNSLPSFSPLQALNILRLDGNRLVIPQTNTLFEFSGNLFLLSSKSAVR